MPKFKILDYQNYLETIKASEGSKMFRNFYVLNDGKKRDILKNGQLSCARYVSSILRLSNLISETHATVSGTIKDMLKNEWKPTKKLTSGNVLVWEEEIALSGEIHSHIGFYLGANEAISHLDKTRLPTVHHLTFDENKKGKPKRRIIQILTHRIMGVK